MASHLHIARVQVVVSSELLTNCVCPQLGVYIECLATPNARHG